MAGRGREIVMADQGHEMTDDILHSLEDRIADTYEEALRAAEEKLQKYLDAFNAEDEIQKQRLAEGEITKDQYNAWAIRRKMNGKHWEEMRDTLAADFHNATEIAKEIALDRMPDVYALNANFGTYQIESGGGIYTGMTLYNHDTAEYLLSQQRQLMPGPSTAKQKQIAANKDMQWNRQKIQSAVMQGVLLGDGPAATAKRLMGVAKMDYNAAIRYARTMTTSAQNAGRYESYRRAKELGVQLTIEWQATLDSHTRHDHRMMHGKRTEVDEPFHTPDGFTILYPADCSGVSTAPQGQIWNCRCTLRPWVKGHEGKTVTESPGMEGMSFEEWQNAKYELPSGGKNGNVKSRGGSRQSREKNEKLASLTSATHNLKQNQDVVAGLKQIVGKHSRKKDIGAVNPNWDGITFEWINNCQRCVTTYEARRRGYDVTALPCYSFDHPLCRGTGYTLPYEKGDRKADRLWHIAGLQLSEARKFSSERCLETIENLMNGYGTGSRAIIDGFWRSNGQGHVFIAENVGGKIQFFDPQNGKMDCESYIGDMSPMSLSIFRIDDLPFNSMIDEVFRNDVAQLR